MNVLSAEIQLNCDGDDIPSDVVLNDDRHRLCSIVDVDNGDVYLRFSSREALYDFAKSLLHEAVFGIGGGKELYPLIVDGKCLVVDGVRLSEGSSRIFVQYPSVGDGSYTELDS